jgi:ankyrin repeat protein
MRHQLFERPRRGHEVQDSNSAVHISVRDFLIKDKGLYQMWPELGLNWEDSGHETLKKSCDVYLNHVYAHISSPKFKSSTEPRMDTVSTYPFSAYACQQLLYHSERAVESIPQCEFLEDFNEFKLPQWIEINNVFEDFKIRHYGSLATLIYILADMGHPKLIRQWSKCDPHVHRACRERYRYPFFAAISSGNKDAVAAILNIPSSIYNGVDIMEGLNCMKDLKRYRGQTSLTWAALEGRTSLIQLLLRQGFDPNEGNDGGKSPLICALENGNDLSASILLENGANIGTVSFQTACKEGLHRTVILMIENGADIETTGSFHDSTALLDASEGGHEAVVRLLIENGADIEASSVHNSTPLLKASWWGHEAIVRLLIEKGADIEARSVHNSTPLLEASLMGRENIVRFLIEKGADIEASSAHNLTPLLRASWMGREATVRLLAEKGANVNAQSSNGDTPLAFAINLNVDIVKLLIDFGADVNFKHGSGETALARAKARGRQFQDTVQLLIDHGAE